MSRLIFRKARMTVGLIALLSGTITTGVAQPSIRAFLVFCNGYPAEAGGINSSVTTDSYIVKSLLRDNISEQAWGVTLEITEVEGEEATADNVMKRFEEFSREVSPDDTVYIHYSGHGVIPDPTANEQFLQFCDLEARSRAEWAGKIENLPARLKILITDCCSSYPVRELAEGPEEVNPWNSFYYLFRLHEGFVNITAASPGQDAFGTERGGFLTVNLASDMQRYKSWDKVFQRTQTRVLQETSDEIRSLGDPALQPQRPLAYSLASPSFDERNPDASVPRTVKFIIPDSDTRIIGEDELMGMTLHQLYFARNEIVARHGFDFSTPLLNYYFGDRFWYERKEGEKNPRLSDVEEANIDAIVKVEKQKGGPFAPHGNVVITGLDIGVDTVPDLFPYSSSEPLSRVAVQNLSLRDLSIARNEIFARHGYPFKSRELQEFFGRKPYYVREASATDPSLSAVEEQNLWLIRKIERLKGGPYKWE
ncbi:MAG: YARHG domain-containing protein [Verrucomicrobiales bacterium]|nr:YARHG domain-containing protein [Verrucomicrobiales bacterium]